MFTGGRQHVKPSSSGVREVRFVGIFNSEVSHGKILSVVGHSASSFAVLQEAKFAENVVVGYSSMDGSELSCFALSNFLEQFLCLFLALDKVFLSI